MSASVRALQGNRALDIQAFERTAGLGFSRCSRVMCSEHTADGRSGQKRFPQRDTNKARKKVCREAKRDAGVATVADDADGHASSFGIDHDSAVLRPAGSFWSDSPSQEQRFLLEPLLLAGVSQKFAHLPLLAGVPAHANAAIERILVCLFCSTTGHGQGPLRLSRNGLAS